MKTSSHCIPCFMRQAKYAAALATSSETLQEAIHARSAALINSFDPDISPPENAVLLYRMIAELSGIPDIFSRIKKTSNQTVMEMVEDLSGIIARSENKLETAARLAIAGNIIDYGAQQEFDINQAIAGSLSRSLAIDDLKPFAEDLEKARSILYLADNCGELVFDRLLIKTLNKPVTLAVKEGAIINDALREDAMECGLDKLCRIISNGTACPGTPLKNCSREFRDEFAQADLIISKGQGNFETLSEIKGPIYFLLMVKCPVVAEHINSLTLSTTKNINTGDMIIMKNRLFN